MVFLSGFPLQPTKEKELPYPRNEGRPSFWRGCWAPAKPRSVQTAKGFAEIRNEQHKSLDKPPKRALRICSGIFCVLLVSVLPSFVSWLLAPAGTQAGTQHKATQPISLTNGNAAQILTNHAPKGSKKSWAVLLFVPAKVKLSAP